MVAPIHHQVVIYAADPQRLARFWAAAMGYELENNEVMIEPLLAAGVAQESDTVVVDGQRFWDGILAIRHPDDPVDERTGIVHGRRILFELQETQKTDENRVHLDLNVGKDRIDEETARIVGLGATLLYERRDAPRAVFNRLTDPEGNEFCIERGTAERGSEQPRQFRIG
jgi:predicted enzyme related to lactoylglutathione lyase